MTRSAVIDAASATCRVGSIVSAPFTFSAQGGSAALVGPNGSGKSTFAAVVRGSLPLVAGSISIGGRPLSEARRTGSVAVVDPSARPSIRGVGVRDWLTARGAAWRMSPDEVAAALERWGAGSYAHRPARRLSTGMYARCLVAVALAAPVELVVLDEPERGLDADARRLLAAELHTAPADRLVLVATHDPSVIEATSGAVAISWMVSR